MIVEVILNLFMIIPNWLFTIMENNDIALTIPSNLMNNIYSLSATFLNIGYILPINSLLPIFGFKLTFYLAKIFIAFVVRFKSFIPTMGS